MYTLIEELARERGRTLLREAEAWRRAKGAGEGRRLGPGWASAGAVRRTAGRWLIGAGARSTGTAVTVAYPGRGAGQGAR